MQKTIELGVLKFSLDNGKRFSDCDAGVPIQSKSTLQFLVNSDTVSMVVDDNATYIIDTDVDVAILEKISPKTVSFNPQGLGILNK